MNRITLGALTVAGTLVLAVPALADHSWSNYHWARTANPFTLALGDNMTSAWDSYLATASSDWSASAVLDTEIVSGGTNAAKGKNTPKNCVATPGRVEVCNAKYGNNGWLGIAQIWISGGHITQGTAKMNDSYFSTRTYNTPAWRQLVICQEIAHTFGLDHQDETFNNANLGSCMDYTNSPVGNEHPNAHDYEQLEAIYAHLDALSTLSAAVKGAFGAVRASATGEENAEWGRALRLDGQGRANVFEKSIGDGRTVITHVFWAP